MHIYTVCQGYKVTFCRRCDVCIEREAKTGQVPGDFEQTGESEDSEGRAGEVHGQRHL